MIAVPFLPVMKTSSRYAIGLAKRFNAQAAYRIGSKQLIYLRFIAKQALWFG